MSIFNNKFKKLLLIILLSLFLGILLESYFIIVECYERVIPAITNNDFLTLHEIFNSSRMLIISILIFFIIFFLSYKNEALTLLFKYRYLVAFLFVVIFVAFELSGSSIQNWNAYLEPLNIKSVLIGKARMIRSDEWAVGTPTIFSQFFSGPFGYFNNIMRAAKTDMFISISTPILSPLIIFRPFYIGYIFFGAAKGLSFFWVCRSVVLFMVTFEFGRIVTRENKALSLSMALLILFAPVIQWWYSAGGLVEILIAGQLAIILICKYLDTTKTILRILLMAGIVICGGIFGFVIYPSWQIPFFYVFIFLFLWVLLEKRGTYTLTPKDAFILLGGIAALGISAFYVLSKSSEAITIMQNTVYPGTRFEQGGGSWISFFQYPGTVLFPIKAEDVSINVCELSVFYDFFPVGLILSLTILFKRKQKDFLLILMLLAFILLGSWCLMTWPKALAKISLLSNCQPARVYVAVGYVNIIVLMRSLSLWKFEQKKKAIWLAAAILLSALIVYVSKLIFSTYYTSSSSVFVFLVIAISFIILLAFPTNKKLLLGLFTVVALLSGALVNPLNKGTAPIFEKPIASAIEEINESNSGFWVVDETSLPTINYPVMLGAATINSTNAYPNIERWEILDPEKKYNEIYNRYAHIIISLNENEEETKFSLGETRDLVRVDLPVKDLEKLNVKYIISEKDLDLWENENLNFQFIKRYDNGPTKIFELSTN